MTKDFVDMQELIAELRADDMLTRDQALVLHGRIATLYELGLLENQEWHTLDDALPLTIDDVRDLRV